MLRDYCMSFGRVFVVVDGLDECNKVERKQVLEALMNIVSQGDVNEAGKLRLLIVSQDYVDIRRTLFGAGNAKISPKVVQISHEDNEDDILMYVKFWVEKIDSKYDLGKDVVEYLVNLTVANAKGKIPSRGSTNLHMLKSCVGMFLFAKLVMRNLYEQPTREALLDAIRTVNFPTELKEA